MTQIAQAYIHTHHSQSDYVFEEWGRIAESLSYETANRVFPGGVELVVSIEPGSTKTRVKVFLAGLAVYGQIAIYPDFKQGLAEMVHDAREFAGTFNEQFIKTVGVPKADIVRKERRTETPGRLLRAINRLEDLQRRLPSEPQHQMEQELQRIVDQLRIGLSDLESAERESVIRTITDEYGSRLPAPLEPKLALRPSEYRFEDEQYPMLALEGGEPPRGFLGHLRTDRPLDQQLLLTRQHKTNE
ncbi:hypothetical protein [Mesorhizobium sp. M0058]|uniref:hypothetical protein n=1 Tax=Mesorhizobium sp. M0058 TaxID=2956865 RepID=UPI003337FED6